METDSFRQLDVIFPPKKKKQSCIFMNPLGQLRVRFV